MIRIIARVDRKLHPHLPVAGHFRRKGVRRRQHERVTARRRVEREREQVAGGGDPHDARLSSAGRVDITSARRRVHARRSWIARQLREGLVALQQLVRVLQQARDVCPNRWTASRGSVFRN